MLQKEAAKILKIRPEHLCAVLRGRYRPGGQLAVRLENLTGVPAGIWLAGTPEQKQDAWRNFVATTRQQ